jgi:hypothetical protein
MERDLDLTLDEIVERFYENFDFNPQPNILIAKSTGRLIETPANFTIVLDNTGEGNDDIQIQGLLALHYRTIPSNPRGFKILLNNKETNNDRIAQYLSITPLQVTGFKVIAPDSTSVQTLSIAISKEEIMGSISTNVTSASTQLSAYQFQSNIIEFGISTTLQGLTGLDFKMPKNKIFTFVFYVAKKVSNASLLESAIRKEERQKTIRPIGTQFPKGVSER